MKKLKYFPFIFLAILYSFLFSCKQKQEIPSEADAPFNDIIERNKYEFDLMKSPVTGKIPEGVMEASYLQGKNLPSKEELYSGSNAVVLNTYTAAGPDNFGGRTRAFAYDVRYNGATNMVMIAGSVSSGVMRSANGGASWTKVSGTANIHDITCVAQDPRPGFQDNWYLGTGEALGNSASADGAFRLGFGVYKSSDNGLTWSRLLNSNTSPYETFTSQRDLIQRIVVDPTNGNIYAACLSDIIRSTDGGSTWGAVLVGGFGSSADVCDIVCTSTGILYAGFAGTATIGNANGVWTSTTGATGSWTQIAGNSIPAGWKGSGAYGRVVLALAPSNQNILYAAYDNLLTGTAAPGADFFQYNAATLTWSANRTANLPTEGSTNGTFTTQGGYDLALAVKPDDQNFVIIGGSNAYTSTDGFTTPTSFRRIGGYAAPGTNTKYLGHHPDVHTFAFEPNSNIKMVSGDDGGLHVTTGVNQVTVAWSSLNNNYQTYQYFFTAIDPTMGSTKYIGGAQDNGTTYRDAGTNTMQEVLTGDGVSVGISNGNTFHYLGFQNGSFYRRSPALAPGFISAFLKPISEASSGLFITLFYLDPDNTEDIYYANNNRLWRNTGASTATQVVGVNVGEWQLMTGVTAAISGNIMSFATTRGTYDASHKLYIGTNLAKIFRLDDPINAAAAAAPVDITPAGISAGSTVIGIAVAPQNDDTVLAVISNYGVPSVFWTGNATAATPTWYNVEGTGAGKLDLPSFRSCAIVAKTTGFEYYVGTSVGLYSSSSIAGGSQANANLTSWAKEGSGVIDQAVVVSLPVRNNDNTMLVGTHGNGMFVANIMSALPVTLNSFNALKSGSLVKLNWTVSSENNVKQYTVERKYSNENIFTQIGSASATPATAGLKNYGLIDNNVLFNKGNIQYRLRVLDIDNRSSLSKVALVRGSNSELVSNVYPTLAKNNINIVVPGNTAIKKVNIAVVDTYGRILSTREFDYKNSSFDIAQLSPGTYYLVISTGAEKFVTKFVKQ